MEIHQSEIYANYIKKLQWNVLKSAWGNIFIRSIPLSGTLAKAQRFSCLPPIQEFVQILLSHKVTKLSFEPDTSISQHDLSNWYREIQKKISLSKSPFIPTKTIRIPLTDTLTHIIGSFSEAKQRSIRKAEKNGVTITKSIDIKSMIQVKSKGAGFLGFITTYGMDKLYEAMKPDHVSLVLAHIAQQPDPIAGVMLLHFDKTTYYWIAGATHEAKKLHTPTLLVKHALIVAQQHNSTHVDFLGVFDERMPHENTSWKGFTKFKEGFGGKEIYYPVAWL